MLVFLLTIKELEDINTGNVGEVDEISVLDKNFARSWETGSVFESGVDAVDDASEPTAKGNADKIGVLDATRSVTLYPNDEECLGNLFNEESSLKR